MHGGGYPIPGWGAPHSPVRDLGPVTGVPLRRTLDQWKYYRMEMGYPFGVDRQTPVRTAPSHHTMYVGSNNAIQNKQTTGFVYFWQEIQGKNWTISISSRNVK